MCHVRFAPSGVRLLRTVHENVSKTVFTHEADRLCVTRIANEDIIFAFNAVPAGSYERSLAGSADLFARIYVPSLPAVTRQPMRDQFVLLLLDLRKGSSRALERS